MLEDRSICRVPSTSLSCMVSLLLVLIPSTTYTFPYTSYVSYEVHWSLSVDTITWFEVDFMFSYSTTYNRLVVLTSNNASVSMSVQPISAPCSTLVTKYMCICLSPLLTTKTTLTTSFDVDRYTVSVSPRIGDANVGRSNDSTLSFFNTVFASFVH